MANNPQTENTESSDERNPTPEDDHAPLTGLRIVAIEQFGAGPFGTLLLADLGAEVIKIEDPAAGGDVGRSVPPGAEEAAVSISRPSTGASAASRSI